jgi:hypothetical protein
MTHRPPEHVSRSYSTVQSIDYQLKPYLQEEAVEILARVMARVIARDPSHFTRLTDLFKHAFSQEHGYHLRQQSGGPDAYKRTGVS